MERRKPRAQAHYALLTEQPSKYQGRLKSLIVGKGLRADMIESRSMTLAAFVA
jgi:hypothetical protein